MSSKEDAAETLSNLSQSANTQANPNAANPSDQNIHPQLKGPEPGPSTHPLGPPTTQWATTEQVNTQSDLNGQGMDPGDKGVNVNFMDANGMNAAGGRRFRPGRNNVQIGSEEWHRRKKESHVRLLITASIQTLSKCNVIQKEVERRRRGNINEGIDALARIVPNGTGEKAKGAILSRSVQYIHHLKENEARNIEKWTLEKLLMDQAMGDLQGQIDEMKKLLDKEVEASQKKDDIINKLKKEISSLKAGKGGDGSNKRSSAEVEDAIDGSDDANKRQKVV